MYLFSGFIVINCEQKRARDVARASTRRSVGRPNTCNYWKYFETGRERGSVIRNHIIPRITNGAREKSLGSISGWKMREGGYCGRKRKRVKVAGRGVKVRRGHCQKQVIDPGSSRARKATDRSLQISDRWDRPSASANFAEKTFTSCILEKGDRGREEKRGERDRGEREATKF